MVGISKEERSALLRAIKTADANFKQGMYALAEPTYRKGIDCLGDGAPEITGCLHNLAHICAERKDFTEALKLDIQLLLLSEERFGEAHPKTIALMDEIAGLYEKLGRTDESRDMYERARKASERSLWADQSNEPDGNADDDDGVLSPAELADELGLGYQYSDTAKVALETSSPAGGQLDYTFSTPAPEQKRSLSEETMKLPKLKDDQIESKIKDPQLETLVLDKLELKKSLEGEKKDETNSGTAAGSGIGNGAGEITTGGSDILKKLKTKLSESNAAQAASPAVVPAPTAQSANNPFESISDEQTVIDPFAPSTESPEVIGADAIKPGTWKPEEAMSRIVLGKTLNKEAQEKVQERVPELVEKEKEPSKELSPPEKSAKRGIAPRNKQPIEVKLFQSTKQRNWILGIFLGCFVLLLLTSLFTSHANTKEDFANMPHRYRTVDGEKLFFLTSPSDCEFVAGADAVHMPYYQHHGDFLDTSRIVFGPLIHYPHWLTKQKNSIIDEQGSPMYAEASPELGVADFAEGIGKAAQLTYLKTKHYPKSLSDLEVSKRAYHNPFTGQLDKPSIQVVNLGKKTQSDDGGVRRKWYDTTFSGSRYPNEAKRHPGAINCYSVIIHTKKGDLNCFYIRPCDRDSKPFIGSHQDTAYGLVLENGVEKSLPQRAHLPFKVNTIRAHRAWLMPPMNSSILFFLRYGATIILGIVALALWILSQAFRDKNLVSTALKGGMFACLLLITIYALTGVLP